MDLTRLAAKHERQVTSSSHVAGAGARSSRVDGAPRTARHHTRHGPARPTRDGYRSRPDAGATRDKLRRRRAGVRSVQSSGGRWPAPGTAAPLAPRRALATSRLATSSAVAHAAPSRPARLRAAARAAGGAHVPDGMTRSSRHTAVRIARTGRTTRRPGRPWWWTGSGRRAGTPRTPKPNPPRRATPIL